jgi:hypothetical protein
MRGKLGRAPSLAKRGPDGLVILGGGIAGLAASMKTGAPVYEASPHVGGVCCRTRQVDSRSIGASTFCRRRTRTSSVCWTNWESSWPFTSATRTYTPTAAIQPIPSKSIPPACRWVSARAACGVSSTPQMPDPGNTSGSAATWARIRRHLSHPL